MNIVNSCVDLSHIYNAKLDSFCTLPNKPIALLADFCKAQGVSKDLDEIREDIVTDYDIAREEGTIKIFTDKILFFSRYQKSDGTPVEITLKRSSCIDMPMFLFYVNISSSVSIDSDPGKALEKFAFLGRWSTFLAELADCTLPEEWSSCEQNKDYDILWQYIKYTFHRLTCENKIAYASDRSLAAFNTGLLSHHYEDIYAYFVPNTSEGGAPWRFVGFCTAGSGSLGKQLACKLKKMPEPAQYITKISQLTIEPEKTVSLDYEHIIFDNLLRFPRDYLKSIFPETFHDCLDDLDTLIEYLNTNPDLCVRIQNDLNTATRLSVKLASRDYHRILPCYFPKGDRTTAIIPLCLMDTEKPDLALVIDTTASGNYQGQTVLTLEQAYIDARLISRLSANWLTI